jgi:hypothetical protein
MYNWHGCTRLANLWILYPQGKTLADPWVELQRNWRFLLFSKNYGGQTILIERLRPTPNERVYPNVSFGAGAGLEVRCGQRYEN